MSTRGIANLKLRVGPHRLPVQRIKLQVESKVDDTGQVPGFENLSPGGRVSEKVPVANPPGAGKSANASRAFLAPVSFLESSLDLD
jgi:hypothetical protein